MPANPRVSGRLSKFLYVPTFLTFEDPHPSIPSVKDPVYKAMLLPSFGAVTARNIL